MTKPGRDVIGEAARAHFRMESPACGDDGDRAVTGPHRPTWKTPSRCSISPIVVSRRISACGQIANQHVDDGARSLVAEELAERLFMPGEARLGDTVAKVPWAVAGKRRLGEMRVLRDEIVRARLDIGEVASSAARDADLLGRLARMIEDEHALAILCGPRAAEKAGRTGSEYQRVDHLRQAPNP